MLQTVKEGKWRLSRDAVMELMEVVVPEFLNSMQELKNIRKPPVIEMKTVIVNSKVWMGSFPEKSSTTR